MKRRKAILWIHLSYSCVPKGSKENFPPKILSCEIPVESPCSKRPRKRESERWAPKREGEEEPIEAGRGGHRIAYRSCVCARESRGALRREAEQNRTQTRNKQDDRPSLPGGAAWTGAGRSASGKGAPRHERLGPCVHVCRCRRVPVVQAYSTGGGEAFFLRTPRLSTVVISELTC